MKSTLVWAFLKELIVRFKSKNPKIFNVFATVGLIAWVLSGLPGLIEDIGIKLPEALMVLQSKVVSISSAVVFIMSQLAVINPDEKKLPITNKK